MTDPKTTKMLEKVRALIAKAESTPFGPEAESFYAKASKLMDDYAIEQWMVKDAQGRVGQIAKPVKREFSFDWWYESPLSSDLWWMFLRTAEHCRCVVASRGQKYRVMPVIGLESDLDYFDLLFTNLMLEMGSKLEPKPDASKSLEESAHTLRWSGLKVPRIAELMYNARTPDGSPMFEELREGNEDYPTYADLPTISAKTGRRGGPEKSLQRRIRLAAEAWAERNGLESGKKITPGVYQRSFSEGFVREISGRYRMMEKLREDAPTADDGPSVALVVKDIRQVAVELYEEMYPTPKCKEEGCNKPPFYMGYCREHCEAHGIKIPKPRVSYAVSRELATSDRARSAGREAGRNANLTGHPSKGITNKRGQLPR